LFRTQWEGSPPGPRSRFDSQKRVAELPRCDLAAPPLLFHFLGEVKRADRDRRFEGGVEEEGNYDRDREKR
jgi:hypothetical protein